MKKSSRNWSEQEDKMLTETMLANNGPRKLKWEQVAQIMHNKIQSCQKTGKQCRERWHNHLAPQLNNSSQWTKQQNETLFQKHAQLGNKWAKIATYLKGRTDNCVKNHFYSTLRRGMRKVNNFIHDQRKQRNSLKQFKADVLTKILIVADGDPQQKLNAKNNAEGLSKNIKQLLIQISLEQDENTYDIQVIEKVIELIMQFNKNCKKRKGKKKGSSQKANFIQKQQQQQQQGQAQQQQEQQSRSSPQQQSKKIANPIIKQQKIQNILIKDSKQTRQVFKRQVKKQQEQKNNNNSNNNSNSNNNNNMNFNKNANIGNNNNNSNSNGAKQLQKIMAKNKVIVQQKSQMDNQNQQKDQINSVEEADPAIIEKIEKGQKDNSIWKKNPIGRANSIESFASNDLVNMNFTGSFYNAYNGNALGNTNIEEPFFKGSGFNLVFNQPEQQMASKQMLADSAIGIKKGQALMYFSAISNIDEKNSFLKFDGEKGVVDTQLWNVEGDTKNNQGFKFKRQANSPLAFSNSFANGSGAFMKSDIQKNFIFGTDSRQLPKPVKQKYPKG